MHEQALIEWCRIQTEHGGHVWWVPALTLAMRDKVGIPLQLWRFPGGWHQLGIAPYHQGERGCEKRRLSAMTTGNGGRECGGTMV